jgi:hypothetical protein
VHHVPSINKNLVSRSLLCRDGFKLVFDSNKVVISKYEQFVGKGYECGGLFCLSLSDLCTSLKLLIMFAMVMSPIFGIHDFDILNLVA